MITELDLVGKTIKEISVNGFGVYIFFTDGMVFSYGASDGGYSSWDIEPPKEE